MKYEATRDFTLGINGGSTNISEGDKLEIRGTTVLLGGEAHHCPSIAACKNMGWLIPTGSKAAKEAKEDKKDKRIVNMELPRNWKKLHWTKKINFVNSCYNIDLLEQAKEGQSVKVIAHIDKQIKTVNANPATAKKPADYTLQTFPDNEDVPVGGLVLK